MKPKSIRLSILLLLLLPLLMLLLLLLQFTWKLYRPQGPSLLRWIQSESRAQGLDRCKWNITLDGLLLSIVDTCPIFKFVFHFFARKQTQRLLGKWQETWASHWGITRFLSWLITLGTCLFKWFFIFYIANLYQVSLAQYIGAIV